MKRLATLLALLILAVTPLYYIRFSVAGIPSNVLEVLIVLFALSVAVTTRKVRYPYTWPAVVIVLGLLAGTAIAPENTVALGIVKGWFVVPLLFSWAFANWLTPQNKPLVYRALTFNIAWVGLYALLQGLGIIPLIGYQTTGALQQYVDQGRALGFFESPNYLGMYLVPVTLFVLVGAWKQSYVRVAGIVALAAIYLTASRSAFLAVIVGAGLLVMYWFLRRAKQPRVVLLVTTIILAAVMALFLLLRVNLAGNDGLRLGVWQVALSLINTHPVLGIGPGQFAHYFASSQVLTPELRTILLPYALHPHNLYMNIWLSGGVLALFGFIWAVLRVFQYVALGVRSFSLVSLGSGVALVMILVQGLVDSSYFKNDLALFFWLFAILAWWATTEFSREQQ